MTPRITPAEALAFALSVATGRDIGPHSQTVKLSLAAIAEAGWEIVARGSDEAKTAGTIVLLPKLRSASR